ncbi:MAG TPA: hypoxanthine-guanine phosphoribosyltransferase [Acidiferrobacterales bacterium]|nr:hypoxanthine-guanine phosphoribosyltransferase [Acidiferrobacterales bacterium]
MLKPVTAQQAWEVLQQADCLYQTPEVEAALGVMARAITQKLAGVDPVVVCVMNGGLIPFGQLLPRLHFPLQTDYIHVTRYGRGLSGGELRWIAYPSIAVQDRAVLLIDDILDEGTTLAAIEEYFHSQGARAVHKAVLVNKQRPRRKSITVEFVGLQVPDRYIFGYGMDYKGYLRNAPGIYAVADVHEEKS